MNFVLKINRLDALSDDISVKESLRTIVHSQMRS